MLTIEQQTSIAEKLAFMPLARGLGNKYNACSIAAINLALTGKLTDDIPDCMSEVIGHWVISVQDSMPDTMRNSAEWKSLLPLAAGTGREKEQERLAIVLDWMWGTALPSVQPLADDKGFGDVWERMTIERTEAAADAAWAAADAAWAAANSAWHAADAVAEAAEAATAEEAADAAWATFDPAALLDRLIKV